MPRTCFAAPALRALLTGLVLAAAPTVAAQRTAAVAGVLVDRLTGSPVMSASVTILGWPPVIRSDTAGRFSRDSLLPGIYVVQVRSLGYAMTSRIVDLQIGQAVLLRVELDPVGVLLPGVAVEAPRYYQRGMQGFEERRLRGRGVYVTEDNIKERQAQLLGDVLRSVPGVREVCRRGICRVRMARSECAPNFFVDGFPANNSTTLEMPTIGIIAIEIYRTIAETPPEFLRGVTGCGTIAIWTRTGL